MVKLVVLTWCLNKFVIFKIIIIISSIKIKDEHLLINFIKNWYYLPNLLKKKWANSSNNYNNYTISLLNTSYLTTFSILIFWYHWFQKLKVNKNHLRLKYNVVTDTLINHVRLINCIRILFQITRPLKAALNTHLTRIPLQPRKTGIELFAGMGQRTYGTTLKFTMRVVTYPLSTPKNRPRNMQMLSDVTDALNTIITDDKPHSSHVSWRIRGSRESPSMFSFRWRKVMWRHKYHIGG